VKEIVLGSKWWKRVRKLLAVCSPIASLLRMTDGPAPCIGKVYFHCFDLLERIDNHELKIPDKARAKIRQLILDRYG
jgi:hypothetical protein